MKINKNYKKIFLLLAMLFASGVVLNSVSAALSAAGGNVTNGTVTGNTVDTIAKMISSIAEIAASGVFGTIGLLITLVTVALYLVMELLFITTAGTVAMPTPDTIVFNRVALFDANFINPSTGSLVKSGGMNGILSDLFASFQVVAVSVFIIAAMIAGIRMATSTIAAKKAQYKEAALKWLSGFIILLCLKWILAGLFYVNEKVVSILYSSSNNFEINVYPSEAIPIFGQPLTDIVKGITELTGVETAIPVKGYLGIIIANMVKGIGGNIVSSIIGFILLGQTLTIIFSYLKRVFMCMVLGVISPLVVAADTVMSATGKNSTVFVTWLKNFATMIFMQSIHAAYMMLTLAVLSGLYSEPNIFYASSDSIVGGGLTQTQIALITIMLTTGLVKLEKLFKSIFGMTEGFGGSLKDGAKGLIGAMGAVKGIAAGVNAIKDNKGKMDGAKKKMDIYKKQLMEEKKSPEVRARQEAVSQKANDLRARANDLEAKGDKEGALKLRREAVQAVAAERKLDPDFKVKQSSESAGGKNNSKGGDYLENVIKNHSSNLTRTERINELEKGIATEMGNYKAGKLAMLMAPANLAAGIGLGIGLDDNMGESLFKGGMITAGLDAVSEGVGRRSADKDRRTFKDYEVEQGKKYDYEPSEKIIREKTEVEKVVGNPSMYINPIAVTKEIEKQMKGIGDVFTDSFKKEIKRMEKDIDNI